MKFTSLVVAAVLSLTAFSNASHAKILQEGWYQVLLGQQHVGYVVQRYVFDDAKKEFKMVSFLKTNQLGGDLTQSLTANCDSGFAPLSYQYTNAMGKKTKLIDAVFKKDSMTAKVTEDGKTKTVQDKVKKGTFLSQFLVYMILNNKAGLKTGNSFEYNAIAEEDAVASKGFADVKETEVVNGHDTFKVANTFKDEKYLSHISPIGETLDTKQPVSGIQVLIATREDATKGFTPSDKVLKTLFGTIPGNSALAKASAAPAEMPAPATKLPEKSND